MTTHCVMWTGVALTGLALIPLGAAVVWAVPHAR